ncbi:DUF4185 domain-containing protein [Poriferisphaera sp. WC338]|uniref:DUF4185 domain-containing protein n=1 Tax=Poriferisphaera sp. WC338 TaxID=3425129 RepID=UPI003D814598
MKLHLWCSVLLVMMWVCGCTSTGHVEVKQDKQADRLFHQDPRWLGGDAALTVPLGNERVLWLFGDSLVVASDEQDRGDAGMVRNSIAVQEGLNPREAEMWFVWQEMAGEKPKSFFVRDEDGEAKWYWPGGGYRVPDGPLIVFLLSMGRTGKGGMWGFEVEGYAVAVIANPDDKPAKWEVVIHDGGGVETGYCPASAVVVQGDYLIGLAIRPKGKHAGALVRYQIEDLIAGRLDRAAWWMGDERGWIAESELHREDPLMVMDDASPENSLHYDAKAKQYVHVATYGFGRTSFGVRTAPKVTGPWSKPQMIYTPEEGGEKNIFVYAGKAHPELVTDEADDVYLTYATNSFDFWELFNDEYKGWLYYPRFLIMRSNHQE